MNSIFKTGSQRPLKQSDFLPLHHEDRTRDLTEQLWKTWTNHVQECKKMDGKQPKLWKCVIATIPWHEHIPPFCGLLLDSICRVIQPLLLGIIIDFLASGGNRTLTYICTTLLVLCCLPQLSTHLIAYKYDIISMRLSSALRGVIYLKVGIMLKKKQKKKNNKELRIDSYRKCHKFRVWLERKHKVKKTLCIL